MKRYKTVDGFLAGVDSYQEELAQLREILCSTDLEETVKWGMPVYTFAGKNVVGIGAFKTYFGLWFFQGALLQDKQSVLINAQDGITKAMRQWRMESKKNIKSRILKSYVKEAIELVTEGKEIKPDRAKPLEIPSELTDALSKHKKAKTAFEKMTKGKQREYATHITDAKRLETKLKRIEKILPMISEGVGLNDKYRNC